MTLAKNAHRFNVERLEDAEYEDTLYEKDSRGDSSGNADQPPFENKNDSHHQRNDGIDAHDAAKNPEFAGCGQHYMSNHTLTLKQTRRDQEHHYCPGLAELWANPQLDERTSEARKSASNS